MGRLIDADEVKKRYPIMENDFGMVINERLHKELDKIPTVEAIPKAQYDELKANITMMRLDYEARLKADKVAILEDLDLLIDEFDSGSGWDGYIKKIDVHKLIQQKINGLRGEAE